MTEGNYAHMPSHSSGVEVSADELDRRLFSAVGCRAAVGESPGGSGVEIRLDTVDVFDTKSFLDTAGYDYTYTYESRDSSRPPRKIAVFLVR